MTFKHKLARRLAGIRRVAVLCTIGAFAASGCTDNPVSAPSSEGPVFIALTGVTFVPNDRVKTTGTANVRSGPKASTTQVGTQPIGALGTVLGGPIVDSTGDRLTRYNVNFDAGADGWVAQEYAGLTLVSPAATAVVASVTVTPRTASIDIAKTVQLAAVAKDSSGGTLGTTMTWLSRDTLKAKVSATGLVTGVALGTVYVLASSGSKADSAAITIAPAPVAAVTITPSSASLTTGGTVQLTATLKDASGATLTGRSVTWASSNILVATVLPTGFVTAVAAGNATITATSEGKSGAATVTVATLTTAVPKGYFVAPNGTSSASGTISSPWNLSTALSGANGRVKPGDTVWVRGGTYLGPFRSTVSGTAAARVVIRQYPGERAIIDGRNATGDNFVVTGTYSVLWGLEFTNSGGSRTTSVINNNYRPNLLINNGSHNRYVNLILHDGGVAFFNYSSKLDVEVYGSIIYNNGWQAPDRGHGHAMYLKSDVGPVVAKDNVIFNQYGYGIHVYTNSGSGLLNNIRLEGNVSFDNGSLSTTGTSANIGNLGQPLANNLGVINNMTYFTPNISGTNLTLGSGSGLVATGNTVVGGTGIKQGTWTGAVISGNTVLSAAPSSRAPMVFVRPNLYEPGRANVVVYNWSGQSSVTVDLSAVLAVGQGYVVRNVQNLFGAPVVSGTFGGGTITIPMGGVTPPTPVGESSSRAAKTGPYFDVFIVTKQ